ncbi:MAG: Uma2 family endonuclease [Anaerolineae bacterium]
MALPTYISREEYLRMERQSDIKHEYFHGEIFAMSGASEEHNLITSSTHAALYPLALKRGCKIYPSDLRVRIPATGLYTYPDISIVCGTPQFEDDEVDTLLNPTIIIEVLSPSTEKYDRGKKFQHYRTLESLQEYILISQDSVRVEHFVKQESQWLLLDANGLDSALTLPSIDGTVMLRNIYEQVSFDSEEGLHS